MTTHAFVPVLGKRLRVTKLDTCGNPPASSTANAFATSSGFISVALSADVEDGTEILQRRADGALCVNEKMANSFKRFNVEIEFCGVEPDLLSLVSNAEPYYGYGGTDIIGFTVGEGTIDKKFAFELWTGLTGEACAPGVEEASGYLLLPFVNAGTIGDVTIDGENSVNFSMTGAYTRGGNNWSTGPFNVVYGGTSTNEVQTVTITGAPTGGSFRLSFSGQQTANIAWNAANTAVETALEALSNIEDGDVAVTGGPGPSTPWVVTFGGNLAGRDVPQMTATSALTGGTNPAIAVTTGTPGLPGVASKIPVGLDALDHLLLIDTNLAPPAAALGLQTMP